MEQYISKSALVAEIEKLIENGKLKCQQSKENNDYESYVAWSEHIATCGKILLIIDILEVKEVDLDLEITLWANAIPEIRLDDVKRLAKHFFELGMQVSNKPQK